MSNIEKITIVVGFDQREAVAYHVFCQSIIDKSSMPIQFIPLALNTIKVYEEQHLDGSNRFIYSRFLTPYLMNYTDWAIYADGDMVCNHDIAELWRLRDKSKADQVVKHDYKTKKKVKYFNNINEDYPKKNWSSLILWNCSHESNKALTPMMVANASGSFLHRFSWLEESEIGEINKEWNWLAIEYKDNDEAKIIHYTLGTPCLNEYRNSNMANYWCAAKERADEGMGE
jgi:lipopolysaccharide biosynthesis glycosyltransferase